MMPGVWNYYRNSISMWSDDNFLSLLKRSSVFFLDSSNHYDGSLYYPGNEHLRSKSRYSYIGINPIKSMVYKDGQLTTKRDCSDIPVHKHGLRPDVVLHELDSFMDNNYTINNDLPDQIGPQYYILMSYDFGEELLGVKNDNIDLVSLPGLFCCLYEDQLVIDWQEGLLHYHYYASNKLSRSDLKWRFEKIFFKQNESDLPVSDIIAPENFQSYFSSQEYMDTINNIIDYITDGHIYVTNMTQPFSFEKLGDYADFYWRMRSANPAPFGGYVHFDDYYLLSTSPERFLYRDGRRVSTEPIKGTRPRGKTQEEDTAYLQSLQQSNKEIAEHSMIVDLLRNDVGRICEYGTIKVEDSFYIESYPSVFQLVSRVVGRVLPNLSFGEIVEDVFPGGSITGTPKIRAMEIIAEQEKSRRSAYTGSIGRISLSKNNFDLNIIIRSILANGDYAMMNFGGGIVFDSDKEAEYRETIDKGRNISQALFGKSMNPFAELSS